MKTKKNVVTSLITLKWLLLFGLATVIVGAALPKFASLAAGGSFGSAVSKKFAFLLPPAGSALQFDGTNDHVTFGNTRLLPGTLTSSPTWNSQANSQLGRSSLTFNGTSQYVTFGSAPELNAANFTLETWFYWTGAGAATSTGTGGINAIPLVTKGRAESESAGLNANYFLGIVGGKLAADFEALSGGLNYPITGSSTILTNTWYHAAVTYDGTCWQLYLNGIPDLAAANCPGVAPDSTSTQHAAIGTAMTSSGAQSGYFAGRMDEVRVWNVARSQAEIFANKGSEILIPTAGLLGRWGLNDGAGSTASNLNRLGVTSFTLEAWVMRDAGGSTMSTGTNGFDGNSGRPTLYPVVTRGMGEGESPANINTNYIMGITSDGFIGADFEDTAGGVNHPAWGTTTVPVGEWHHIAAAYNGNCWSLYFDGNIETLNASATACPNATPESTSYQHPGLAAALNSSGGLATGYFAGTIDEARVWDHALLQGEIQTNKNVEITSASGLLARWGMNEGSGTTVNSSVGTFPGTLTNGPLWVSGFPIPDSTPPAAPTNLQAAAGNSAVNLNWTAPADPDVAGYNIYRSTSPSVPLTGQVNGGTLVNGTSFNDTGLANGQIYYYVVTAVDTSTNESSASNEVNATPVVVNTGLEFTTASGAYVTFGDPAKLDLATFTIETWFKRTGTGTSNTTGTGGITIVPLLTHGAPQAEGSNVDANWILGINTSGNVIAADMEDDQTGQNHPISGITAITNDVWHHAAATYDGTTWRLYLNGNLENTSTPNVTPRSDSTQHAALGTMIRSDGVTTHGRFQGVIDEARVWNVARTGPEILGSKNSELTSGGGLVARWGLNEGTGTVVGDSISTPADGTIVGANFAWVAGFVPPAVNTAPNAPVLNSPADSSTGISTSPTLDVDVSDIDTNPLTVTFYGRPFASGVFTQIAQNTGVASGTNTTANWANIGDGQTFEWYVTVNDGSATTTGPTWTFHTSQGTSPVFVGVGDIASCDPLKIGDTLTGNIIKEVDGTIFTTGDNVYPNGTPSEFLNCYATTPWGDPTVLSRTRPVPGNHDWGTGAQENLDGYFGYFGANANAGGTSYYSYDIDSFWHVVNLDSECQLVPGGCGVGSSQEVWLRADLAANSTKNVIAIWHKPRYSSGNTNYQALQPLWDALYEAGVDILLNGHDHIYERFTPMKSGATPSDPPVADPAYGIQQFTLGLGGEAFHTLGTPLSTSLVRNNDTFGIFKLTLHQTGYDWVYLPIDGGTFTDSGTGVVHGSPPAAAATFQDGLNGYTGTRDTYIWEDTPGTPRGSETTIVQDINASDERRSLLSFDLSSIPANATIVSAELQFEVQAEGQGFNMHRMLVGWDEATVSYASLGSRHLAADGNDAETSVDANWAGDDGYLGPITVSVPAATIQSWVDGTMTNNGWLMIATHSSDGQQLYSREHSTVAERPKLTVQYDINSPQTTVTFQNGVSSYSGTVDTNLRATQSSTPQGSAPEVEWDLDEGTGGGPQYGLVRFENLFGSGPGQVPSGVFVTSATLSYTVFDVGDPANVNEVAAGVTWDQATATFDNFGGEPDVQTDEYGNLIGTASGISNGIHTIDVTSSIQDWYAGTSTNNGWIFRPTGSGGVGFRSSEYSTVGARPNLSITYSTVQPNQAPDQPVLISPADDATNVVTPPNLDLNVTDPDGDPLTVTYYGRPVSATPGADFTIVALPDTQFYSSELNGGTKEMFASQTQWIVNERSSRNIAFVTQLGDCVQNGDNGGNPVEWNNADAAISLLENPLTTTLSDGIPYGIAVGNHDQSPIGNPNGTTTFFNQYFGESRFMGRAYYGGHYGSNNDNHYQLFSASGMDFIIIHFEYDTSANAAVLAWADNLLQTHSNRRAILVSHHFVNTGNPASFGSQGQATYDALKGNPNLFLMLNGHVSGEGRRQDTFGGNTVYSLLSDYQSRTNGGNGWLRIMTFSPANNQIQVQTYSPTLNQFETDADSQFTLSYDMNGGGNNYTVIGTNTNVTSGSNTSVSWSGLNAGTEYEWYATVSDGSLVTTGPVWSFTTEPAVVTHTLSYNAGANGSITGTSPQMVNSGADGTAVTAVPDAGYHFVNWSDGSTANPRTDTNVSADITVTANFAINTYTLTYNSGANGSIVGTSPQVINHGADGTAVTAVPDVGYNFVDWSDGSTTNPRTDTNVTTDITVTANFAINQYTLTYTAGANGTLTGTTSQSVNHGADGTAVTAVPDAGYHFVNWSDASTANPRTDTNVTTNISVTANFAINTYTLTYNAGANGSITGTSPQTVNHGADGTSVTAVPDAGYNFVNWSDGSTSNPRTDNNVTADITVTANFAINTYTLTYNAGANGSITGTSPQTVNSGADGTAVTAVPDAGYHFVDWSDGSTANPRTDTNITANITVTANFAIDQFTIDASAGTGGSINPSGTVLINYDGSQTFTITPDIGYHVADVLVDTVSVGAVTSYTFNNITANHTITVSFAVDTFTIDASAGANGSISPSGQITVNYDGSQAFTITPDAGYQISNVLVDNVSVGAVASYTFNNVTANHTISATFSPVNLYTISGNIQQYNFPAANSNLSGVTVNLDGDQTGSMMTDVNGNFGFTGLASGGNYLITPTLAGYNFDPMSRSYSNVTANITTANFTGYTGSSPRVVSVGSQNVLPNSQAVVPINLLSQGNENSVGFSISYDPAVLSNPVVAVGADCGDCGLVVNDSMPGQLAIIASKPSGVMFAASSTAREVVTITFNTTGTPPMYTGSLITFGDTPITREVTSGNADTLFATYSDGAVTFAVGYETDLAPRPAGNNTGIITVADYTQTGRFAAGLDAFNPLYNEMQRADSAPRATRGNGLITVADYTQAGRYAAGLDSTSNVGGPAFGSLFSLEELPKKLRDWEVSRLPRIVRAVDVGTSAGQQVTVSIEIDAEGDENGFGFTITYDESKLSNPVVTTGADLPFSAPFPNTMSAGKVGVITAAPPGQTIPMGTREIVKIRFDVSPTAPAGPTLLTFTGFPPVANEVSDVLANSLPTTFTQGTVNILGPTAANTSVGGIIRSANGRAINRAQITLTDSSGSTRTARSNMFGYYRFGDVAVGETYVINIRAKNYTFVPRIVTVEDEITNLDLTAEP